MIVINSGINNCYYNIAVTGRDIPGAGCIDVCARRAARLACIVKTPQFAKASIIWNSSRMYNVVRLSIQNIRIVSREFELPLPPLRHGQV